MCRAPSPPVPQVSTTGRSPRSSVTRSACSRIASAKPAISSIVSPRMRSAVSSAPICDLGVAVARHDRPQRVRRLARASNDVPRASRFSTSAG